MVSVEVVSKLRFSLLYRHCTVSLDLSSLCTHSRVKMPKAPPMQYMFLQAVYLTTFPDAIL